LDDFTGDRCENSVRELKEESSSPNPITVGVLIAVTVLLLLLLAIAGSYLLVLKFRR
jgi:hypothetical protein